MLRLRFAQPEDAESIAAIYAPIVEGTPISMEEAAPSPAEVRRRIAAVLPTWPWVVADDDGAVLGYAYASRHRERAGYRWAVDTTVYVSAVARGRGLGRKLYDALFRLLERQGYARAYAGITLPNDASVGLHRALGFEPVGVYRGVGFKLGAWRDVSWWSRPLAPPRTPPPEPLPLSALGAAAVREALAAKHAGEEMDAC